MYDWFECKVKLERTQEDGSVKKVQEAYMVDAFNFTEAEKRIVKEMEPFVKSEFEVADIRKMKIAELFDSEVDSDDRWYKLKLTYTTVDEKKGKEKKVSNFVLVRASSIRRALDNLEEGMKGSVTDYAVTSATETPIMDVFQYEMPPISQGAKPVATSDE